MEVIRRPGLLSLMGNYFGVDVGGTKLLGAVVDEKGQIQHRVEHPTDKDAVFESVVQVVRQLDLDSSDARGLGLAVAGFVESSSGRIHFAPNLPKIEPDLAERVAKEFGVPTVVENDANAAAWAESRFGAGPGAATLIMVTVGTGIGGGIVIDGNLYRGSRGFGAEFGHMVASVNGELCACGRQGCLEAMASGTALARMARERAANHPQSEVVRLAGGDPDKITGAMVGKGAAKQDQFALELFADLGRFLGLGLAGLAHAFDPEVIIVGGGVADAGDALLGPTADQLSERFQGQVQPPPVVAAKLGNEAGVIGAASLAGLVADK